MILGAAVLILAVSVRCVGSPPVHELKFVPGANTNFTCAPAETEEIDHTTFALNHSMFQQNVIPGVQFERQIRTTNGPQPAVITTLTFDSRVCGLQLCCCYFNGTGYNCRDCYLLVCCTGEGQRSVTTGVTTTVDPTATQMYMYVSTTPGLHNSISDPVTSIPPLGIQIGLPIALAVFCIALGIVGLAIYCGCKRKRQRNAQDQAQQDPVPPRHTHIEAASDNDDLGTGIPSPPSSPPPPQVETAPQGGRRVIRTPPRGDTNRGETRLFPKIADNLPPTAACGIGAYGSDVIQEEATHDRPEGRGEQTSDLDTSGTRLIIIDSPCGARYFCPQVSVNVQGGVVPSDRIPSGTESATS